MSKIVDRDTFLYYLDNADVDWEATARECIAKGFELGDENKKLKEKLNDIENILIKCTNAGCKECECTGICEEYLLKIIRGEE